MKIYKSLLIILSTLFLISSLAWITKLYISLDRDSFYAISGTQENYSWAVAKLTMSISDLKSVIIEEEKSKNYNKSKIEDSLDILFSRLFVLSDNVESTQYLFLQEGYSETIKRLNYYVRKLESNLKESEKVTKEIKQLADTLRKESNKVANLADHAETYQRTIALNDFLQKRDKLRYLLVITWLLTITMSVCTYLYIKSISHALEKERNAVFSKNAFLAKVGHELRTSLQVIIGTVDNLTEVVNRNNNNDVQILNNATNKILRQIKDLTDYVRIDSGVIDITPSSFSIGDLIRDAVHDCNIIYGKTGVEIEFIIVQDFMVTADKERTYQIIENLVSNAFKYTDKGSIKVSFDISDSNILKIYVRDTGIGIAQLNLAKIFIPFTRLIDSTSNVPGTGMGLAIVKGIVEAMGGKIQVESEVDHGTVFTTSIPLHSQPIKKKISKLDTKLSNNISAYEFTPKFEVLVIDDDGDVLTIIQKMITRMGHKCDITHSPERAIQKTLRKPYNIILTDLQMPCMTGIELIERIKKRGNMNNNTPIIIMTGYDINEFETKTPILKKPIRSAEMELIINTYVNKSHDHKTS
ncbi:hybrid sensor histidine kinase/response regulator [Serratia symbiotica]|uniref:hybrid sensor histidine kinase/response regulator n=1 Tax=Serratia symbiotica TaxID=138074 RepID=UPI001CF0B6EA|nr:hybrid sensor histidine kinase/response regulator [Serratia symbiotica]